MGLADLLNGKGDELMYERHVIVTGGLPFAELKARSLIDTRARAANDSPDFSQADQERSTFRASVRCVTVTSPSGSSKNF